MNDILIQKCFEQERWTQALSRGYDKDIRKDQLYSLTDPKTRAQLYAAIRDGSYRIAPPHAALIPKDTPGEYRRVLVNEPIDRILLSIINEVLFELCPSMIHPACKSYLKGTGCGQVVREVSQLATSSSTEVIGWKSDLSKYFDSVPIRFIDDTFDKVETITGPSAILNLLKDYYHNDLIFDEKNNLVYEYTSLKQGCAVAAFLADAVLFPVDEKLTANGDFYRRYSDDMLNIGPNHQKAMTILVVELAKMDMRLNPKKVETLSRSRWFKFLGFSIKGPEITLSASRIKSFQKEIENRTIRVRKNNLHRALASVNRFLYKGDGNHSWATLVLPIITVKKDVDTLNTFVMDCLRATQTGHRRLGGLGYNLSLKTGCIQRGRGRNVSANLKKTDKKIEHYLSLGCMRKALLTNRDLYNVLVAQL